METTFKTDTIYELLPESMIDWDIDFIKKEEKNKTKEPIFYTYSKEACFESQLFTPIFTLTKDDYISIDRSLDLEKDFKLWNKKDIQEFIELYPEINEYIKRAIYFIDKYFKPTQEIELRLVSDDESTNSKNKILFLYIPVNISPQKAIELLHKIDRILFDDQGLNEDIFDINIKFR